MPIPLGYSRSTFYGSMPGGDIFNWSLWANEAPANQQATQDQANAFATEFQVAPTGTQVAPWQINSADTIYTGCRVYSYNDATGKASFVADAPFTRAGTQTTNPLPNQCAIVVTLKTAVAGRRAQGRVYLPLTGYGAGAGAQLSLGTVTGLAQWFSAFITRLNSHISTQHIGVLSQAGGTFHSATAVVVDSRVDIQRRRANKQVATNIYRATIS